MVILQLMIFFLFLFFCTKSRTSYDDKVPNTMLSRTNATKCFRNVFTSCFSVPLLRGKHAQAISRTFSINKVNLFVGWLLNVPATG